MRDKNDEVEGIPMDSPNVVVRRANDFKRIFVSNFNIGIDQQGLEISIITDSNFGASQWAESNLGTVDSGSAKMEIVEEAQMILTPRKAREFLRVTTQSLIKKEILDEIEQEEGEFNESIIDDIGQIQLEEDVFDEFIESMKEKKVENVDKE